MKTPSSSGSTARALGPWSRSFGGCKKTSMRSAPGNPRSSSFLHVAVGLSSYPLDGDTSRSLILAAHERLETAVERGPDTLVWR